MELKDTPLWHEITAIAFDNATKPPAVGWKVDFLTEGNKIRPMKLLSATVVRDFRQSYGDEIMIEVMIGAGDFVYDIYPYRRDLKVMLTREAGVDGERGPGYTPDIETQELRAILMDDYSVTVEGHLNNTHSKSALNLTEIMTVRFQLLDLTLERLRLHAVGGLFRDVSPAEVLEYILTTVSTPLDLDETNKIKGVQMVESPNTDKHRHIIIPHGTKVPNVPHYLHKKVGGIYASGLGVYLFKQYWYVYPLYDLTRYDSTIKTLTLINVPKNQFPGIERTFRKTANQTIALITGEVKHSDRSQSQLLNQGNGARYLDARNVIDGFADTSGGDNKAVVSRQSNNNEFVTDESPTGLENVQMASSRITANKFAELSKLAQRAGSEIQCVWENSDMGAIYPGMPVKYMYVKDDQVHELKGVVLAAQHYIQTHGVGMADSRHRVDTALHLFVSREQTS